MVLKLLCVWYALMYSSIVLADLQVYPIRVVFKDGQTSSHVTLRHKGKVTTRYRISLKYFKMDKMGALKEVEDPSAEKGFAGPFIRYSPRMVTLEPEKEQVVRLKVRRPRDLADGEYRAHLNFVTFEDAAAKTIGSDEPAEPGHIRSKLYVHRGVAIPIVIRSGALKVDLAFDAFQVRTDQSSVPKIYLEMHKKGNRSIHGDFQIFAEGVEGEQALVGVIKSVSLYDDFRTLYIRSDNPERLKGTKQFRVEFKEEWLPNPVVKNFTVQ